MPSPGAGARTRYVVDFNASATGGMSGAANSNITVTFPNGTDFEGYFSGQVVDTTTGITVGSCGNEIGLTIECSIFNNAQGVVNAGDHVRITFGGITNPTTPANNYTVDVSTTSDTSTVTSADFSVLAANQLTGLTVANAVPSAGAGARTRYLVDFN